MNQGKTESKTTAEDNGSIRVKTSYIYISLLARVLYSALVFFSSWILFVVFYASLALSPILVLIFAILTAIPLALLVIFLERILKGLCGRWDYSKFLFIQRFGRTTVLLTFFVLCSTIVFSYFYPNQLPLWAGLLILVSMIMMMFGVVLLDFYTTAGEAALCLRVFLWEFDRKAEETDFERLLWASKKIARIAMHYNMEISPYSFSLGMTISFLKNRDATRKDFDFLIKWIEVSTQTEHFQTFKTLVKKYNSIAKKSAKEGISEKHHWTFERMVNLLGFVIVPLAITVMAIIIPKLLEMFWKFPR